MQTVEAWAVAFRFLRARRAFLEEAATRVAFVTSLAITACPSAYADKSKAPPPPPRPAPQVNRPAPPVPAAGRPAYGAMGQQAGMRVPGQQAGGAGFGGAVGGRPVGSASLHLPTSVRPQPNSGSASIHPAVAQARPAPVRSANRPETSAARPVARERPVGGKPAGGNAVAKSGPARPDEANARNPARPVDTHVQPVAVQQPEHPATAPVLRASRENLPAGRPVSAYPIHDAAAERATLQARTHDFHTHDVAAFSGAERARWSHGAWSDGWHYGRRGWWWQVDGVWYPYSVPVYPYPAEVEPPAVYDQPVSDNGAGASADLDAQPAEQIPPAVARLGSRLRGDDALSIGRLPAAQDVASHCTDPDGDYPDVRRCMQPWVTH